MAMAAQSSRLYSLSSRRVTAAWSSRQPSRPFSTTNPIPLIVQGKEIASEDSFPVVSPLTGKPVWSCSSASAEHVDSAIAAAQQAFSTWGISKASYRRDLFLRAANVIEKRRTELGEYMHHEIGANEFYQKFILGLAIEGLKDTAGRIAGAVTGSVPESIHDGIRAMVLKRPYGVNLGIAPWNAPYHLGLRSVTFALATGNTAILKGSELSPHCYWAIVDIFREAGLPDGCLNLIFSRPEEAATTTEQLIAHPHVKKINFTGSTKVGSIIASTAGKHLKPVLMELGGKANAIVLKDADVQSAAVQCATGAFINAGQICMSTERILVHSSIAGPFREALTEAIRSSFGPPDNTPVVVTAQSAHRVGALIADAVSKGAKTLDIFDGHADGPQVDTIVPPVVLENVTQAMEIYGGESFGPCVSLYTFETEEEAVERANDTAYGLSASIFTDNLGAAFRVAEALESGAVHINSMSVHDEFSLPHGGVKASGFGRFNGYQGLEEFLYTKSVTWMES